MDKNEEFPKPEEMKPSLKERVVVKTSSLGPVIEIDSGMNLITFPSKDGKTKIIAIPESQEFPSLSMIENSDQSSSPDATFQTPQPPKDIKKYFDPPITSTQDFILSPIKAPTQNDVNFVSSQPAQTQSDVNFEFPQPPRTQNDNNIESSQPAPPQNEVSNESSDVFSSPRQSSQTSNYLSADSQPVHAQNNVTSASVDDIFRIDPLSETPAVENDIHFPPATQDACDDSTDDDDEKSISSEEYRRIVCGPPVNFDDYKDEFFQQMKEIDEEIEQTYGIKITYHDPENQENESEEGGENSDMNMKMESEIESESSFEATPNMPMVQNQSYFDPEK
uniref:CSON005402 protein n=1 Tax=Culicoides sonorensis TaxID=179676 RepID=A0A336L7F4_CULSO